MPAQLAQAEAKTLNPLAFLWADQAGDPAADPSIEVLDADPAGEFPLSAGPLSLDAVKELTVELKAAIQSEAGDGVDAGTEPAEVQGETESAEDIAMSLAGLSAALMRIFVTSPSVAAVPDVEKVETAAALLPSLSRLVKALPDMSITSRGNGMETQAAEGAVASPGSQIPGAGDNTFALWEGWMDKEPVVATTTLQVLKPEFLEQETAALLHSQDRETRRDDQRDAQMDSRQDSTRRVSRGSMIPSSRRMPLV